MWQRETIKILVIDDDIKSILQIQDNLKPNNYIIISSCNEQAVKVAMEEAPDIILLEIALNSRNGLTMLSNLKKNRITKNIPIIVLSHLNTQMYWDESYIRGADAYMVKSMHFPWLNERIKSVIKKSYNKKEKSIFPFETLFGKANNSIKKKNQKILKFV